MDPKTENNPYLGFVYTSFQERATKVSHRNTAKHARQSGDEALAKLVGSGEIFIEMRPDADASRSRHARHRHLNLGRRSERCWSWRPDSNSPLITAVANTRKPDFPLE